MTSPVEELTPDERDHTRLAIAYVTALRHSIEPPTVTYGDVVGMLMALGAMVCALADYIADHEGDQPDEWWATWATQWALILGAS